MFYSGYPIRSWAYPTGQTVSTPNSSLTVRSVKWYKKQKLLSRHFGQNEQIEQQIVSLTCRFENWKYSMLHALKKETFIDFCKASHQLYKQAESTWSRDGLAYITANIPLDKREKAMKANTTCTVKLWRKHSGKLMYIRSVKRGRYQHIESFILTFGFDLISLGLSILGYPTPPKRVYNLTFSWLKRVKL